jgi:hypothetical protein
LPFQVYSELRFSFFRSIEGYIYKLFLIICKLSD